MAWRRNDETDRRSGARPCIRAGCAGLRRKVHLTLPADVADRLERIAVERRTSPAVIVTELVTRRPIRPGGDGPAEPAGGE